MASKDTGPLTFSEYQAMAAETAVYPGCDRPGSPEGVSYVGLGLGGESGEVLEHCKKALRDDAKRTRSARHIVRDGIGPSSRSYAAAYTSERREKMVGEIGDVLWYLSELARQWDLDLGFIARMNSDKLASRAERGTIHGDGSDR